MKSAVSVGPSLACLNRGQTTGVTVQSLNRIIFLTRIQNFDKIAERITSSCLLRGK